ncbi:uncharacterized protein J4E84_000040 [Alternaria hordeiaustralica]|uniref:uncharacterized protein n=1 Tax=Alternaria hordeiaustralica TaxID=1187925 RepID=UPI0020C523BC|nr:uncharacterized protein J4E84_000040 [Alternaria hordeiaustralica]KAI4696917.1 hypothetical protein J4E84_000040 [Alternaria hordeiaustralica]
MASVAEARRSPFSGDPHHPNLHKSIPILPSSSPRLAASRDPMDITPSSSNMGPPNERTQSVSFQLPSQREGNGDSENTSPPNGNTAPAVGAAAAAQQPKVVQTAFIHKLYNMLEDQSIQHLISWASTNESFVMSPSSEFSKVLSSYFKHTNISSFVRQLNMYGFHKVSDVFHTGSPDTPLWEFKHGNGNFKRGDLVGLREIKRRASRHALVHRESFPAPKMPLGPPAGQAVDPMPDPVESRLQSLEYNLHDMHARMQRSEDTCAYLTQRSSVLAEGMMKCHQWNQDLANLIMQMVPDPENPIHRDVAMMQREIARQTDMLRALEPPEDAPLSARQSYFMQPPNPAVNSPYASGYNSTQWPSSPRHPPIGGGDQQLRDALESYQLPRGPRQAQSRHGSPPPPNENMPSTLNPDAGWTLPGARYPFKGLDTGPPTRRSSMASNVHSLLNPAETAERSEEDEADDVRKRKRMQ